MRFDLNVQSHMHAELVDISSEVQECVSRSGVAQGICVIFAPHTTAGITCNENWDPSVQADILMLLDRLVPQRVADTLGVSYAHSEGNSAAHIKASLMGASQCVPVENGELTLGTWQGIYLTEFDGPRQRRVLVRVVQDGA
jgi:secondary thiamine-phosphate synthase enzyme